MDDLIIIGGGGHAKVVLDILKERSDYNIIGFISKQKEESILNVPNLGRDKILPSLFKRGIRKAFIAIGDNKTRSEISKKVKGIGFSFVNVISKSSVVSPTVRMGRGIVIMPGAIINVETHVKDLAIINTRSSIDHDCVIGEASHIGPGSILAGGVSVGRGSFLGAGSIAIPNITVGRWVQVGAGTVLIRNIPSHTKWVGNPARQIGKSPI